MKSQTHTLQSKSNAGRKVGGLDRVLFSRLRNHADDPAIKRVDEILSLLVSAASHLREWLDFGDRSLNGGIPEFLDLFEREKESERAYYQTLELLNIKLSRYRWRASLSGDIDGFRSEFIPAGSKGKWKYSGRGDRCDLTELWKYSEYTESFVAKRDQLLAQVEETQPSKKLQSSWESVETFMVASLLKAVNSGEISRYRRCSECRHWFYAIRGHQHFCGEACRRKHEAQDPKFKEKRATYMRETYRKREREREESGKRAVGFSKKRGGK